VTREAFQKKYADVFKGDSKWQGVEVTESETYDWPPTSTYIQNPPYFRGMSKTKGTIADISGARVLALLGDMITTDHISPAGSFKATTPAGKYLTERQVPVSDFNSYGSRRGNHEVMMRGTFANIRIKNEMLDGVEGGYTKGPDGAADLDLRRLDGLSGAGTPLVIFGGIEYGAGSSRDWAAKGTNLLGVKAVIAESFERIHRSNLVGMGVIPFEFTGGDNRKTLGLKGDEVLSIGGWPASLKPLSLVPLPIKYATAPRKTVPDQVPHRYRSRNRICRERRRAALCAAKSRQVFFIPLPDFKSAGDFRETAVFFPLDLVSENAPSRRSGRFPLLGLSLSPLTPENTAQSASSSKNRK
jgi:aconitate hydratase